MRKHIKDKLLSIIDLIQEAHQQIKMSIRGGDLNTAISILTECQQSAIAIGNAIEESEGEGQGTVTLLENYCEAIYQYSRLINNDINENELYDALTDEMNQIRYDIQNIKSHKEILFLPYKASMWDSFESIWTSAKGDENCTTYVVPIPYYFKNADGSFSDLEYEGDLLPEYVDITSWQNYDLKIRKPDVIFIHNPYDDANHVTSVDPSFYCRELRKYTDMLVYIPYFIGTDNIDETLCVNGGTLYSDKVIVQSEAILQVYKRAYRKFIKEMDPEGKFIFNYDKFIALGSPKIDKIMATERENVSIPKQWKKLTEGKRVILYNTTINELLEKSEQVIDKIKYVLQCFKEYRDEVALLWRPHPLSNITCYAMRPDIAEKYIKLVESYIAEGWGIYDDTPNVHKAIAISDAYMGDKGSLLPMYGITGKPVMVQNHDIIGNFREYSSLWIEDILKDGDNIWFPAGNFNGLFRYKLIDNKAELMCWLPGDYRDRRMYGNISRYKDMLILTPLYSDYIIIYHIETATIEKFLLKEPDIKSNRYKGRDKFFATIIYKHYVFFIGAAYPAMLRMDLESRAIDYYYEPFIDLERYSYNKEGMNFRKDTVIIENSVYLACRNSNIIMRINLDDCTSYIWRAGDMYNRYNGICYDGNNFWLPCINEGAVIKWNIKDGVTGKLFIGNKDKGEPGYFAGIFYHKDYVWVFMQSSDLIYKINIYTNNLVAVDLLKEQAKITPYENMKGIVRYFFVKCIDDEIFAYSTIYNALIRFNLLTEELVINEMIAQKEIRDIINADKYKTNIGIYWENAGLSVSQYISMIASKDTQIDEQQVQAFSRYFANAFENAGERIFQYLINLDVSSD